MRLRQHSMRVGPKARGAAGLTMVELLIAASIVAVSLLAVSMIFPVALSNINVGGDETAATSVGLGFQEMARNVPWNTLLAFNNLDSNNASTCPAAPATVNTACLAWIDQVKGNPAAGIPGLPNGQAQVSITTGPGLNPLNTQQLLAVVQVAVSYTPREAWLPVLARKQVVFTTRRSQ